MKSRLHCTCMELDDLSAIGAARRRAMRDARVAGLEEAVTGRLALVVTEAASNAVRHGGGGQLIVRVNQAGGVEVLTLDTGPGMRDLERCLRDGYSTAGSSGTGLGAITRLADEWDVYSRPGKGTVLHARIGPGELEAPWQLGVVALAAEGEEDSGDSWQVRQGPTSLEALIVDGLGHGMPAATAARLATQVFEADRGADTPTMTIQRLDGALRRTRGAAVAVAQIHYAAGRLRYAGIGNIATTVMNDRPNRLISRHGIVGYNMRQVSETQQSWPANGTLIMHTDGLSARWSLEDYPGLSRRKAAVIAGVLFRDYGRGRDDSTIVVLRKTR